MQSSPCHEQINVRDQAKPVTQETCTAPRATVSAGLGQKKRNQYARAGVCVVLRGLCFSAMKAAAALADAHCDAADVCNLPAWLWL